MARDTYEAKYYDHDGPMDPDDVLPRLIVDSFPGGADGAPDYGYSDKAFLSFLLRRMPPRAFKVKRAKALLPLLLVLVKELLTEQEHRRVSLLQQKV